MRAAGRGRWCLLWAIVLAVVQGCATVPSTPTGSAPPTSMALPASTIETGRASWYGKGHQGRPTASGEPFDMNALTAAHPSLPFGTRLRVVNLDNERAVEVRVNDRGPSVAGRIIDLSYAAARALGAVGAGIIPVRVTVLP
jgi:rare lipoprotein A